MATTNRKKMMAMKTERGRKTKTNGKTASTHWNTSTKNVAQVVELWTTFPKVANSNPTGEKAVCLFPYKINTNFVP